MRNLRGWVSQTEVNQRSNANIPVVVRNSEVVLRFSNASEINIEYPLHWRTGVPHGGNAWTRSSTNSHPSRDTTASCPTQTMHFHRDFLPLGFLTGLLGVNVSGIPGADSPYGFTIFNGFLGLNPTIFRPLRGLIGQYLTLLGRFAA